MGMWEENEQKLCTSGREQWGMVKGQKMGWEPGGGEQWRGKKRGTFVII